MGKITIIIESKSTSNSELESIGHSILECEDTKFYLPEDAEVFVVPADD